MDFLRSGSRKASRQGAATSRKPALALTVAAAALGLATLAHAERGLRERPVFPQVQLPFSVFQKHVRGEEAVRALAGRLAEVANWYGEHPERFAKRLRQDRTAWLDREGRLLYIDDFVPAPDGAEAAAAADAPIATTTYPLDQTFKLHSRPGAQRVIYLDFNGHTATGTAWNTSYGLSSINSPAFDLDGNAAAFSTTELERIQAIWKRVAEDYAPFDVNVTTEEPSPDLITRSSSTDSLFGTRVVVTRDFTAGAGKACNCGGFAYVGMFDYYPDDKYKPAYVFFDKLGPGSEKYVAEAISHEAGHNLGLSHDGTASVGYYAGHGSGATGWAPIMGSGYYKEVTQWSRGEYSGANNTEDDLGVIQSNGAPLRADDHGDSSGAATRLAETPVSGGVSLYANGRIERNTDQDYFWFDAGAGDISLTVAQAPKAPNLDIRAELYNSAGQLVASANPVDALSAPITLAAAPAGTYYLRVIGVGKGSPASDGYSNYASLGEYTVSGSASAGTATTNQPPTAVVSATPTSGTAPVTVSFSASGSADPDGSIAAYSWNFGDGSATASGAAVSHSYGSAGTYVATLTVTDNQGAKASKSVTITVNAPSTAKTAHVHNITLSLSTSSKGTRAIAKLWVYDQAGKPLSSVTVKGQWSGVVSGPVTAKTSSTGGVTIYSPITKSKGTFTYTVNSVSKTGYTYAPAQNNVTSVSISN